jgi:hypothetical protein
MKQNDEREAAISRLNPNGDISNYDLEQIFDAGWNAHAALTAKAEQPASEAFGPYFWTTKSGDVKPFYFIAEDEGLTDEIAAGLREHANLKAQLSAAAMDVQADVCENCGHPKKMHYGTSPRCHETSACQCDKKFPLTREGLFAYFDQMADANGRIDTTADWLADTAMLIVHECHTDVDAHDGVAGDAVDREALVGKAISITGKEFDGREDEIVKMMVDFALKFRAKQPRDASVSAERMSLDVVRNRLGQILDRPFSESNKMAQIRLFYNEIEAEFARKSK